MSPRGVQVVSLGVACRVSLFVGDDGRVLGCGEVELGLRTVAVPVLPCSSSFSVPSENERGYPAQEKGLLHEKNKA